jgi:type IV pilus assembly protein PilB
MARLDLAERRKPQDGTIDVRFGDKTVHLRVSVLPTGTGERIVLRVLDKVSYVLDLGNLGFQAEDLERIHRGVRQPTGLVLVTGPKGSGLRSTLYSLLDSLNSPDTCILTAENPIEFNLDGIGQVQVKEELGYTYGAALAAFLAQDPDAIMVQELREPEVARMAIDIALEKCLILSSVAAADTGEAIRNLVELGVQPMLLGAAIRLVIAQRGIRKLCRDCRVGFSPSPEQLQMAGVLKLARPEGAEGLPGDLTLYRPGGCERCGDRGYRGRLLVYEILEGTAPVRDAIAAGMPGERVRQLAIDNGMVTMAGNAWGRVLEGQTSLEEFLKVM